jgi:hypothetical protein
METLVLSFPIHDAPAIRLGQALHGNQSLRMLQLEVDHHYLTLFGVKKLARGISIPSCNRYHWFFSVDLIIIILHHHHHHRHPSVKVDS